MITVNAMGDACPIPVVKTKNAIKTITKEEQIEVLVDNDIAVQNLTKMAQQMGCPVSSEKLSEASYRVLMTASPAPEKNAGAAAEGSAASAAEKESISCIPDARANIVVAVTSDVMGHGNDELGKVLIKGFLYALLQQDKLPETILFYNGGAKLTCEGSQSLEDIRNLEAQGVEIMTCGTCLNYYGIADKLAVGEVTNMYVIAEKLTHASLVIKP